MNKRIAVVVVGLCACGGKVDVAATPNAGLPTWDEAVATMMASNPPTHTETT